MVFLDLWMGTSSILKTFEPDVNVLKMVLKILSKMELNKSSFDYEIFLCNC